MKMGAKMLQDAHPKTNPKTLDRASGFAHRHQHPAAVDPDRNEGRAAVSRRWVPDLVVHDVARRRESDVDQSVVALMAVVSTNQ